MDEIIARAFFTADNGKGEIYRIELQLVPHGGFDYGNGNALIYKVQDAVGGKKFMDRGFDARYDSRFNNAESFRKHAYEFVRDQIRDEFTVVEDEDYE